MMCVLTPVTRFWYPELLWPRMSRLRVPVSAGVTVHIVEERGVTTNIMVIPGHGRGKGSVTF